MSLQPVCVLYTQDPDLARRVKAYLHAMSQVRVVTELDRLEPILRQTGPALLIVDLRAKECRELIEEVQDEWSDILIVALGIAGSEPLREADQFGIYAAKDLELERRSFQAMARRAFDHLKVVEENRDLREASVIAPVIQTSRAGEIVAHRHGPTSLQLLRFPRVFRRFDNVDALLVSVVESVADVAGVTRTGIFSKSRQGNRYRLRAGLCCLPETYDMEFGERDPLVRWFQAHVHLISRAQLAQTADPKGRTLMRRALNCFGAEVIVPLYARDRIIGWMFFGHRATGEDFDHQSLEGLTILAEHAATLVDNALLHEQTTLQKTLAETLLNAVPPGIVAMDEEGTVQVINPAAERILGVSRAEVLNKPVEAAGTRLAGLVRETFDAKTALPAHEWIDHLSRRSISVETRPLVGDGLSPGVLAIIQDLTAARISREKQTLQDRAALWNDMAASMSHEFRNPLVAIKTFAQLLPERFDDADFRQEFNQIVVREIDRLDTMIDRINNFAHPSELVLKPIDLRSLMQKGIQIARDRFHVDGGVSVETELPSDLPRVMGDESALAEALAHLVANAAEALAGQSKGRIMLSAKPIQEGKRATGVLMTVRDNGKGIAPELRERIFSPFYTTKSHGMGLGLPIVQRTVVDHEGRIDIDSTSHGTLVNVILPASRNGV